MVDVSTLLLGSAVKSFAELVKERVGKQLESEPRARDQAMECLDCYLPEVLRWSGRIQFFGMAHAETTDAVTVGLSISTEPRRIRGLNSNIGHKAEIDLLQDGEHYILLGDPGAGKTTTLKRLVYATLTRPPATEGDIYRYPIVVRLREHLIEGDLYLGIAVALGLPYEYDSDPRHGNIPSQARIGRMRLRDFLPKLLNDANALLMLDGLDELSIHQRGQIESQIEQLANRLHSSKIIITSRSGEYNYHLDGFSVVELCPLSREQVEAITDRWLDDPQIFLSKLDRLPYRDVADRPLLLAQLLLLFKKDGYLPDQPAQVYRRLVMLLLEEWDRDRRVQRKSRYAHFDASRKLDFLAALAYHLTYRLKRVSFLEADLLVS